MKKAIVFVDANNWYHNVKKLFDPGEVDIVKVAEFLCMVKESVIDKRCEVCLLISGDADFVPALDLIKNQGKEVLTAMVPFGYSSELINHFPFFILKKETLMKCLRDYKDAKFNKATNL